MVGISQLTIAANNFGGNDLLENAAAGAQLVAEGFNELWEETLDGNLYVAMCKIGVLFAVATLTLFMVQWGKHMLNGEEQKAYPELIWPLIVIALLANNGSLLATGTLGVRNYINSVNNFVLEYTAAGANLRAAYNQAIADTNVQATVGNVIEQCRSTQLSNEESIQCLKQAEAELKARFPQIFRDPDTGNPFADWVFKGIDKIDQAVDRAEGSNPIEGAINKAFSGYMAYIGSVFTSFATTILLALNNAYQWGIELTMLLTALLGPLAVGGSLLPFGSKPIIGWLTGFFTVGMAKLCFNIIVGLAGQLISNAEANQPMIFLLFIGIVSPLLASGLAAGGGIAVLVQITKAVEWVGSASVGLSVDVAKSFITKRIGK
ncbi:hypothetical protein WA1_49205 [Scytonema hofmannii PCC 7110]|uniref:NAD/NADP transhydrogenase beta subunit n=1 Tax=Scytonema hofmannii PCC 7110 TaxID=128403 RepID=A0A139WQM5_9CYAN|nr:hypothetical protein [Scytonema hofmannii]KYC34721.1 hypothetical protein WA1_49205 [Scytonema hofmannii PCC 7110]